MSRHSKTGIAVFCALALGGSATAFATDEAAPSLLPNGDFEAGPAGVASKAKLPRGWRKPLARSGMSLFLSICRASAAAP